MALSTEDKLRLIVEAAEDVKAERIETLDLQGKTVLADYFVICSGNSDVHVRAISERINEFVEKNRGKGARMEGYPKADWVLLDFGDVVAHVMREEQREYYNLEEFWADNGRIEQLRARDNAKGSEYGASPASDIKSEL